VVLGDRTFVPLSVCHQTV